LIIPRNSFNNCVKISTSESNVIIHSNDSKTVLGSGKEGAPVLGIGIESGKLINNRNSR